MSRLNLTKVYLSNPIKVKKSHKKKDHIFLHNLMSIYLIIYDSKFLKIEKEKTYNIIILKLF